MCIIFYAICTKLWMTVALEDVVPGTHLQHLVPLQWWCLCVCITPGIKKHTEQPRMTTTRSSKGSGKERERRQVDAVGTATHKRV